MGLHFKIVCTGWKNWPWVKETLASIDMQTYLNYDVCVVDDASGDENLTEFIPGYCEERGWKYILQPTHVGAVVNQRAAIQLMDPAPEDVIVFLDPDGDRFAHEEVLYRLTKAYADGSQVVWSQYDCDPPSPTSQRSEAYPPDVIRNNSYRAHALAGRGIVWNHLRTVTAELYLQLTDDDFKDDNGDWFDAGTDSAVMFPCLELARGKVKFFDEILMLYRPDHEHSDWVRQPKNVDRVHHTILGRAPKC